MQNLDFRQHEKLLHKIAWRVLRRVRAAGCYTLSQQDLMQEAAIAWCVARDRWDASLNVPFSSYLARGVMQHLNRFVEKEIQVRLMAPLHLDQSADEFGSPIHEVVADPQHVSGEEQCIVRAMRRFVFDRLSPTAKLFVQLLDEPPAWLVAELNAMRARAEYARTRGIPSSAPKGISSSMVMDFIGATALERKHIYSELRRVSDQARQVA